MIRIIKANIGTVLLTVSAFLLGLYHFGELAPLSAALCVAVWIAGGSCLPCFLASVAGCGVSGILCSVEPSVYALFSLMLIAVFYTVWNLWRGSSNITALDKLLILALCEAITVLIFYTSSFVSCVFGLIGGVIACGGAIIVSSSIITIRSMHERRRMLTTSEQTVLCLLLGIVAAILSDISPEGVSFGVIFAYVVSLISAYSCGLISLCTAVCACIGASASDMGVTGAIAIAAMVCSVLNLRGKADRYIHTAIFTATVFVIGVALMKSITHAEVLLGSIIFILIPRKALRRLSAYFFVEYDTGQASLSRRKLGKLCYGIDTAVSVLKVACENDDVTHIRSVCDALSSLSGSSDFSKANERFSAFVGYKSVEMNEDEVSGDSMGVTEYERYTIATLSDGMGTGEQARAESRRAIDELFRLIHSGFSVESAVDCVNSLLLYGSSGEIYATLDIFVFDRETGQGKFVKLGASPGIIMRGNNAYTVCCESLPVGILSNVCATTHCVKQMPGDVVILMSDGVCDALGAGLILNIGDCLSCTGDPNEAAKMLIARALRSGRIDDMSAMFVFISENSSSDSE